MRWPRHFLGLPLHPMLVHFPLVLWLAVPVLDALALAMQPNPWWPLALWATGIGAAVGLFALATGLLEFIHLSETGSNDVRLAAHHGVRTAVAWCVMVTKLIAAMALAPEQPFIMLCLGLDLLACSLLLQGALLGTRITYGRYGGC